MRMVLTCRAPSYGFSKYSGKIERCGRDRPTFAIRAQVGLLGTSVSPNRWVSNGILRKSHIPAQDT